jgi:hypothetical protein
MMLSAIWMSNVTLGINITVEKGNILLNDCIDDEKNIFNLKNPTVSLSLDKFIIKNIYIPEIKGLKYDNAVQLQLEMLLGNNYNAEYHLSFTISKMKLGTSLFVIAIKKEHFLNIKAKSVIPDGLSLVLYGKLKKLFSPNKNTMFVFYHAGRLLITILENNKIVFMRENNEVLSEDIVTNLKMSSQSSYFQYERHYIACQDIIVYSNDKNIEMELRKRYPEDVKITTYSMDKYIDEKDRCCFVGVGAALFGEFRETYRIWNVINKKSSKIKSLKRIILIIFIVLIIFVPIYDYSTYFKYKMASTEIEKSIAGYQGQLDDVTALTFEMKNKKQFMEKYGSKVLSYLIVYEFFRVFNNCRNNNIRITTFQAKDAKDIMITGFASEYSEVAELIKKLKFETQFINDVKLNYSTEPKSKNVTFHLEIELKDKNWLSRKLTLKGLNCLKTLKEQNNQLSGKNKNV